MSSLRQFLTEHAAFDFEQNFNSLQFEARYRYITRVRDALKVMGATNVDFNDETESLIDAGAKGSLSSSLENASIKFDYRDRQFMMTFGRAGTAICGTWDEKKNHLELTRASSTIAMTKRDLDLLIKRLD